MEMKQRTWPFAALALFVLWTAAVCVVDVRPIGPGGSSVGLAGLNRWFCDLAGVRMALYTLTDWLSLIPAAFVAGFGLLGLRQWISRRSLSRVDGSILWLGGFYAVVFLCYAVFEALAVNARPVLIGGRLEASYPSSTTVLTLCVMLTARTQLNARLRVRAVQRAVSAAIIAFTALMVAGRLFSGVHWLSDIIGGALLSAGLVGLYNGAFRSM